MQTFLPYPSFVVSARVLDLRRLGKQVIEAGQIIRACFDPDYGWQRHPAVTMWRGHEAALTSYLHAVGDEWERRRGREHGAVPNLYGWLQARGPFPTFAGIPGWLGDGPFHASHRSNLLRKDPEHYGQFGWTEPPDLPYVWPTPHVAL